ncbi:MAG: DUF3499 family protein [Nitriliruptor sp.]
MADSSAVPSSSTPRSRVVRSLARAAERPCSRPGCPAPARATLTFSYATAAAFLEPLSDEADPQRYDLCARHAARTEPPRGWNLEDRRPEDDRAAHEPVTLPARDLGSDATVAVLAAALRAVPDVDRVPATARARPDEPVPPVELEVELRPPDRRRSVVETLLSASASAEPASPLAARHDTREDPTVELPAVRAPRPVPAAGDRGPATDW